MKGKSLFVLLFLTLISACSMSKEKKNLNAVSYLALGDSYTIGESVDENLRWPNQLVTWLRKEGIAINDAEIIAKTGWRADQTLAAAQEKISSEKFDLISILVGVNNQYQKKSMVEFETDFRKLIDFSILHAKKGKSSIFVLSIPDYGVTPFAGKKGPSISKDLEKWNAKIKELCLELNIEYHDITPISQLAKNQPNLIAQDGLHPSGKMYTEWVDLIVKSVRKQLSVE
ncbi:MAG: SGNH/GDSL hydrolase family protein [Bacteroidetes bacterium]|nr:SGNH/GDSL hydrolase family protein [Bacteroidota bacterium]